LSYNLSTQNSKLRTQNFPLAFLSFFSYHRHLNQPLNFKELNTKEFIHALAEKLHVSQKEAANLLKGTTRAFLEIVSEEKKLTLLHLGSIQVKKNASRTAYLPALNKKALVPPRRVVQFHAAETLKNKLKNIRRP
jgi:nucleoid DNA-binding protein